MKRDKDNSMWTLVMYDLPIKTKEDVGAANRFNHLLADLGFVRVQSPYTQDILQHNREEGRH